MGIYINHLMQDNFLFVLGGFFFFFLNMVEADFRGTKECINLDLDFFSVIREFFSFYYQLKFRQRQRIPSCGHITLSVYHQIAVRGRKSPLVGYYCWSSCNCLWLHISQRIMWYRAFSLLLFFPSNFLLHVCIIFAKE